MATPARRTPDDLPRERLAEARQHSLLALVELSRALSSPRDVYQAVDALMLNLMGLLGSGRAVVWLSAETDLPPVAVRCQGTDRATAALVAGCWSQLAARFAADPRPLLASEIPSRLGAEPSRLVAAAGLAVLAPLWIESEVLGMVALGAPLGNRTFVALDLEVLEAATAIASTSLGSLRMQTRVFETNRLLRQANRELEGLDRLKSEFVANVNHELRTPLAVLIAGLDCLNDFGVTSPQAPDLVARSLGSARGLKTQIERLLQLSDLSRKVLLADTAEHLAAGLIGHWHEERRAAVCLGLREIQFENHAPAAMIRCDALGLRRILDELLDNAVKFTPPGSHIGLRLSHHLERGRGWVRLAVSDDGPGIPADQLATLFEKFRQVDASATREVGGLGIGLSLAREVAEAMGGTLTVASRPGHGTTFTLNLPVV